MPPRLFRSLFLILTFLLCSLAHGQDRIMKLKALLEQAVVDQPGLEEPVEVSVNGASVQEFLRGVGTTHKLNISVAPEVTGQVINNFTNARVLDILLFLCKNYDLDIEIIGSIIAVKKYVPPPKESARAILPDDVDYRSETDFLSLDLKKDTLQEVAREITRRSGRNVILAPGLEDRLVSVFIQNRPFDNAMEKLAIANGLKLNKTSDLFYILEDGRPTAIGSSDREAVRRSSSSVTSGQLKVNLREDQRHISVDARDVPLREIVQRVSDALQKNYFVFSDLQGNGTLYVDNVTYEELLAYLFNGSPFTYRQENDVYLIGERTKEGLRRTELVRFKNRMVESIAAAIPGELKQDISISEFVELNGLVISGSYPRIAEVKGFLQQLDQVVPVVMIEVMIVDVNSNRTLATGIRAGIGSPPAKSNGTFLPGVNYNMNSSTVNDLINSFNGIGLFNLGRVTPDFYLSIQALESDGMLKTRSTPQLSTLNGHEAKLSIGQTEYYLEVRNDIIGTQNPTVSTSQIYKPVDADLSLTIKPYVSSDDHVTLDIELDQSNFTDRINNTAPPGTTRRNFKSIIRVGDRDMVMLGGLEEKSVTASGQGLPLLSRIPVLKWFFGNRTRTNSKAKLAIFIKPSIIY